MLNASPMLRYSIVAVATVLSALVAGCEGAAELIPGETGTPVADNPDATPTPVVAPPIVPPGSVDVSGEETPNGAPAEVIPDAELARSVVQLQLFDTSTGLVELVRAGSGVVIDRLQRLILTSYVLVDPFRRDGTSVYSTIAVGVGENGEQSTLRFEAEILTADPKLDIAVLRATRVFRGDPIGAGEFDLPAVTIGDANSLERGDALRLLGYPGLNLNGAATGQPVIATTATVTGFRGSATIEGRSWLKTDARLPYGIGGGPTFNATGALVGIASQLRYDDQTAVAAVRPVSLATDVIERARRAAPEARYPAPLQRPVPMSPAAKSGEGGIPIFAAPVFAANALEGEASLDLFDYTEHFESRPPTLHYEYAAQGMSNGALVAERWYLDGVFQDALSSSFRWSLGPFGIVTDRLVEPSPRGIPEGVWVLEVWVEGVLRTSGTVAVTFEPQLGEPRLGTFEFGSQASAEGGALLPPSSQARQLLAFFDYEDAGGVTQMRWIVFHDGRVVYQSPLVPWDGGDAGMWWVGYASDAPIGSGTWEFEIYLDSPQQQRPLSRGADGVTLF